MVISSLFKPISSSTPAAASGAGSTALQAVSNAVDTLAGSLLGVKPADGDGVRFDFSSQAMQASADAAAPADEPPALVAAAAAKHPEPEAAVPAATQAPAGGTDPSEAGPAAAVLAAQAPAQAAAASGGADAATPDEVAAPAAAAARSAAQAADPDAEALARAWAIKAQGREGAQTMVDRVAALSTRPWPTDAAAERTEKAVKVLKADQEAAASRTLAVA